MPAKGSHRVASLPLPALLSQVLVAFTIEFDDEFERQMPHRTTDHGVTGDSPRVPWLVSLVMYANFMRFLPDEGITVRELFPQARLEKKALRQRLQRMARWWGYVTVAPPTGNGDQAELPGNWIVRPSAGGAKALRIWRGLFAAIEERWEHRFGKATVNEMRASLAAVASQFDLDLPEYLPILKVVWAGWFTEASPSLKLSSSTEKSDFIPLSTLLSRVLLAFALEFERESDLSLAIGSNLIRVLNDAGVRLRDLPQLTGVSKEAIKMMLGFLTKHRFVAVESDPVAARTKVVRLTAKGIEAQHALGLRLSKTEKDWRKCFGAEAITRLRSALEDLAAGPTGGRSPLMQCIALNSDGWRAARPLPETLPHYPLVLHRGGFPDGS